MLGVELDEAGVVAVAVDEQGAVLARVQSDAGGDLAAAAAKALGQVQHAAAASGPGILGVAAISPESPVIAAVVSQIAVSFGGAVNRNGAVMSGTAAAAAEEWVGAARGV